ncbi:MAG: heme ABC exporter, ATP-binding protein CcmA [Legionellales bacterium RIFCSPHIGHO2_12_FULL_35_11]|nr:MAG: heme ABC exporter, ATP-binding protein CcmA [Legionellales bacterium RIFCSPHIGHO2_12_FULL_35_11]
MHLHLKNISFKYSNDDFEFSDKNLFSNINLAVNSGSATHIIGKNGSGKTTLLKIIVGIIYPDEGEVLFCDKSICKNSLSYRKNLCYLGHKNGINLSLTVGENCEFDLRNQDKNIELVLKKFDLLPYKDTLCSLLSSGYKRRVGLVRVILSSAKIWILDEPIIALDVDVISEFISLANLHIESGGIIIYTSHQPINFLAKNNSEYYL